MVFSGFGIHPRRKVTWSKVLQVLQTRRSKIVAVLAFTQQLLVHTKSFGRWDKPTMEGGESQDEPLYRRHMHTNILAALILAGAPPEESRVPQ